jgi:hypothetical protein
MEMTIDAKMMKERREVAIQPLYHQAVELINEQLRNMYNNCNNNDKYEPRVSVKLPRELNICEVTNYINNYYHSLGYRVDQNCAGDGTIIISW